MMRFGSLVFASFFAAQFLAWSRGLAIGCGCFGGSDEAQIGVFTMAIPFTCTLVLAFASIDTDSTPTDELKGT